MATPISKSKEALLTQELLQQSHYYNPKTGLFYIRLPAGKLKQTATVHHSGYVQSTIRNKIYAHHRLAFLYMTGTWPSHQVDHIDGNPSNNKWENLREANRSNNMENLKAIKKGNKSTGLLGAHDKRGNGRITATIVVKGKCLNLGTFDTPEEAHQAYIEAKRQLHSFNTL